jgi:hypothetical protein
MEEKGWSHHKEIKERPILMHLQDNVHPTIPARDNYTQAEKRTTQQTTRPV